MGLLLKYLMNGTVNTPERGDNHDPAGKRW
jgi:hypothetical protein